MANAVVSTLIFNGSIAGTAAIQSQGIAGGLTFQLPNVPPIQGQLITAQALNGTTVVLGWVSPQAGGGGTDTSFSAGNFTPLFTTAVANPTTTPALSFIAVNQAANGVYAGPASGGAAAPTFRKVVIADLNSVQGDGGFVQISSQNGAPTAAGQIAQYDNSGNTNSSGVLLSTLATLASPTFTGTVTLPAAVHATSGSDLIVTQTGANKVRIATATGVFDFFGTGGGMTLATQNASIAIDATGKISLTPSSTGTKPVNITLTNVQIFANNAGALGGGLVAGDLYRTGADPDVLAIVH